MTGDDARRHAKRVHYNTLGHPIGLAVPDWTGVPRPDGRTLSGKWTRLEKLDLGWHATDLFNAYSEDPDDALWTYMAAGPFAERNDFYKFLTDAEASTDPLFLAVVDLSDKHAVGLASFMRIDEANGVLETGYLAFAPRLQQSRLSTEAHYLMMCHVFDDLGYRRYEWKCDELNEASCRAAERLGFQFEGVFRQAVVYKGRNRDTAWYSVLDHEWPDLKQAFERYLDEDNFDEDGKQRQSLLEIREAG